MACRHLSSFRGSLEVLGISTEYKDAVKAMAVWDIFSSLLFVLDILIFEPQIQDHISFVELPCASRR